MATTLQKLRAKVSASKKPAPPPAPSHLSPANQAAYNTIVNNKLFKARQPAWFKYYSCPSVARSHRDKTIQGLVSDRNDTTAMNIAFNIFSCSKSKPCLSPFCPYCRNTMQDNAAASCDRIFGSTPKNQLCFLTVLLPVTYAPQQDAQQIIKSARKSLHNIFNYRNFNDVVLFGFFEIDIKTPKLVAKQSRAPQVLKALGFNNALKQPAYLVHFHALVDLKGHNKAAFRKSLTRVFNKPYQVRLSALRSDMTKKNSINNIARYMLKFRTQHSNNLFGNQASGKAKYGSFYEDDLLCDYVKLHHALLVQNRISSFSIKKNC